MARETHFNRVAPFFRAPEAYGFGLVLLLLSFAITADRASATGQLRRVLYGLGMLGFLSGIALEVYGFYLRIRISGWAPVTNMYETVIWVALMVTILGLVFELISRKTYVALAASGIALLATVLAANVPLLDANIKTLPPVLRDNFWLTIHVLTIVSSYAAFALALGLGLLALAFYLTATYRRTASFRALALPLLPGLPLLALGAMRLVGTPQQPSNALLESPTVYYLSAAVAGIGGMLSIVGVYALLGELANRAPRKAGLLGIALALGGIAVLVAGALRVGSEALIDTTTVWTASIVGLVGVSFVVTALLSELVRRSAHIALSQSQEIDGAVALAEPQTASHAAAAAATSYAAEGSAGGVATLARPSVAEIRARAAASRPKLDARGFAMQSAANLIKPIANFVYRAMQVGVLLVAAGTALGGFWADYSWGRFWGWDPKEVWALITLLVYLVPLHGRFAGWVNTFGLVAASVVCFLSVLMAWYGVNFVLGVGLHSYGFTEGGGQGIVTACTLAVLAVVGATAWRRHLSSQPEVAVA
jgi:ABC-type transport system involved in cytochrome c biogenesis permease subunit